MNLKSPGCTKAPYGLSFPVHELVLIRAWAEKRGLRMQVLLDQVLDGAEFEEMLLIRGFVKSRRALTLWCIRGGGVVAQCEGGHPRAFDGVQAALSHASGLFSLRGARGMHPNSAWRRLLGLPARPRRFQADGLASP